MSAVLPGIRYRPDYPVLLTLLSKSLVPILRLRPVLQSRPTYFPFSLGNKSLPVYSRGVGRVKIPPGVSIVKRLRREYGKFTLAYPTPVHKIQPQFLFLFSVGPKKSTQRNRAIWGGFSPPSAVYRAAALVIELPYHNK